MSKSLLPNPNGGSPKTFLSIMAVLLECALGVLFYGIYTDTIGVMSDIYLSELPGIGGVFSFIDEEMTVSHLLAAMLSFFSCAVPIYIWSVLLNERVYEAPKRVVITAPKSNPSRIHAVYFCAGFALEVTNLYMLIAQHQNSGPLPTGQDGELLNYLADNSSLGIFVSVLMAIINTVIALLTVKALSSFKNV